MFLTIKKWSLLYLLTFLLLFAGFAAVLWRGSAVKASSNVPLPQQQPFVLVIDPGHGGEDGGTVALDGTVEADINLAVATQLNDLARFLGVDTIMTRYGPDAIPDPDAASVRARKVSDLKNRAALANSTPNGVLLSIHQNSLPEARNVHGAQVFFNAAQGSDGLARTIQDSLNTAVNDRPKEPKAAGSAIYLLQNTAGLAVLVECGFLSNEQETQLLKTPAYQARLSVAILAPLLDALQPS